jgi:hypothetical protein
LPNCDKIIRQISKSCHIVAILLDKVFSGHLVNWMLKMMMFKFLIGFVLVFLFQAQLSFADEEIICRVKGSGQKIFLLDSGFFSSTVFVMNSSGQFVDWCPETESQKPSFGRDTAICKFSGTRLGNKLAWGETVIDFTQPSWNRRYRFAKLGQTWKESQPGGRERATCRFR